MTLDPTGDDTGPLFAGETNGASGSAAKLPAMTIGPYRLLRLIGEGGMGQVWLAEQLEPVRRNVAIKLIKAGMDTRVVIARFQAERQALALMDHPAIAKVFDAGSTEDGRPYFVMEFVAGLPITEYCDEHRLTTRQRLELFVQVCDAVQHAHQKAILHRDLKPSNILVTVVDGRPVPRIIDFGVAKAISREVDAETMFTEAGAVVGTLNYMSPEQANSGGEDIDTRSDVYSLGVVLYELLVGALPLDLRKLGYLDVLRRMREEDAPRPSTRVRTMGEQSSISAQNRGTDVPALRRQLRGDADAITLKALEKERRRRYGSPSEFAADITRYLRNEPVAAHPPSFGYRARKYVRRHRIGVLVGAVGVLMVVGFVIAQAYQLRNIRRQRDRADRISEFMTSMFKVSDPRESLGNTITAREILDKSSREIETGLGKDAVLQAELMQVMATTYTNLGLYPRAESLARSAYARRRRALGEKDPKTIESMAQIGIILSHEGRSTEAEGWLRHTIDVETRLLGPDNQTTMATVDELSSLLERQAHFAEAEKLERKVVETETAQVGAEDLATLRSRNSLAAALQGQSRFAEAEKEFKDILEIEGRTLGPLHPFTLVTMHNLANMYADQGRFKEAEPLYRQALATETRVLGPEHPDTASTMTTLANTVRKEPGRQAEAEALFRQALTIQMRTVGPEHVYTTSAKEGLGNLLSSEQHYSEAEQLLQEVLATRQRTLGPSDTDTLLTEYNVAEVLFKEQRYAEAERRIRETLRLQTKALDANDPDTLASKTLLARVLLKESKPEEAERLARQAFTVQLKTLGPQHSDTQDSLAALGDALLALGRYEEVGKLYVEDIAKIKQVPDGDASGAWYNYAALAAKAGQRDDAFAYLREAVVAGFTDIETLRTDEDMNPLRKDRRFAEIADAVEKRAATKAATQQ